MAYGASWVKLAKPRLKPIKNRTRTNAENADKGQCSSAFVRVQKLDSFVKILVYEDT
jgi:hypothetical protein